MYIGRGSVVRLHYDGSSRGHVADAFVELRGKAATCPTCQRSVLLRDGESDPGRDGEVGTW
jgi:hypothetical protein